MSLSIPGNWTFRSPEVAEGFDAHVRESLPWYDLLTVAIGHLVRLYLPPDGRVYDIGCSTGNIGRAIQPVLEDRKADFRPIDSSQDIAERYRGPGKVILGDAIDHEYAPFDVAILFLTMMFLPTARRRHWLRSMRERMRPGGVIVIVDKMEPGGGYAAMALWRLALAGKLAAGAAPADIIAKELSLSGVQRPLRRDELPSEAVEWFRMGDFAGWLIERMD